jgi:sialic acid synthase SpsE
MIEFQLGEKTIGQGHPTYFIADIGANHDGDIRRAIELIELAKAAGADAAKFQNFHASEIVSDYGFRSMGGRQAHQSKWAKSVYEVYEDAAVPDDWTVTLKKECERVGIEYFSSPYDFRAVELLDPYVPAFKVGSGDIDWHESLEFMASRGKPILLAAGAATLDDVRNALDVVTACTSDVVLMQCNTNYSGDDSNFDNIHLNVLKSFGELYPEVILGLSDHTPGHSTVLGAVALGASVIEKHFTDDNSRVGPDHSFAMTPQSWREMVDRTRELERALRSTEKFVADNEQETQYVQRRCLRARFRIESGQELTREMISVLRPADPDGIRPPAIRDVIGCRATRNVDAGEALSWEFLTK